MTTTQNQQTPAPARPVALVTGGNRGLGRATALALAADGSDVVLTYRSHAEEADAVVAEIAAAGRRAAALRLDTADVATFPAFVAALGTTLAELGHTSLDQLVHNAGLSHWAPVASTTQEQFDETFDVNLKGVFFLTQALLPVLADGARIVTMSSGLARFTKPGFAAYAAAKAGIEALTRYLAVELAPRGITVNVVAPGPIATDFGRGAVRDDAAMQSRLAAETALGRLGTPEEIGSLVATMASARTGWVTGQRVEASGGMLV